mmetsp:Transcript_2934/g.4312  ORF Transcript_2934/g.4312 Transcript_2934/m.4312 type:complete len:201 (+) Transcript_2934:31-633(+)|eukprot:CAMPEP_0167762788 /NCGR_PEP_ID=MMETSP0110_2-20121227/12977_1 /TAXON_ID=629695 /ORGANISM="Gymnochlora sp., Strain CCMP2014" /LENGTH=200 /DNA_ID=CAMNT_0007649731 /DNA_START=25 /DNA_END=627 /DNA_ORIENTATION=-
MAYMSAGETRLLMRIMERVAEDLENPKWRIIRLKKVEGKLSGTSLAILQQAGFQRRDDHMVLPMTRAHDRQVRAVYMACLESIEYEPKGKPGKKPEKKREGKKPLTKAIDEKVDEKVVEEKVIEEKVIEEKVVDEKVVEEKVLADKVVENVDGSIDSVTGEISELRLVHKPAANGKIQSEEAPKSTEQTDIKPNEKKLKA